LVFFIFFLRRGRGEGERVQQYDRVWFASYHLSHYLSREVLGRMDGGISVGELRSAVSDCFVRVVVGWGFFFPLL
jgi:hypothetical protein